MNYVDYMVMAFPLLALSGAAILVYLIVTKGRFKMNIKKDTRTTQQPATTYLALLLCAIIVGGVMAIPLGSAQVALRCEQAPTITNTASGAIVLAGSTIIQLCSEEEIVASNSAFTVTVGVSGPGVTTLVAVTTVTTLTITGCSASAWSTLNDVSPNAYSATASATITMSSSHCRAVIDVMVTYGSPTLIQVRQRLPINVDVTATSFTVDNLNRLCDFSAIGAPCTQASLNVHQDPVCTSEEPCFHNVTGSLVVMGNVTVNQTAGQPPTEEETFEWSLYVIFLSLACFMAHLAETRRDWFSSLSAGILFLIVGFIAIWEQSELGFTEVPGLLIPMLGFTMVIGASYLVKTYRNWRSNQ